MNRSLETIVTEWVTDNSKVIDFGCGDGSLLKSLTESRSIMGYGVENDPNEIHGCIKNGISVVQQDICLLYTSPSPRDLSTSRMPSSA